MRGHARGHPTSCARGRDGTGGYGVEASSSFSTPADVFGGVLGRAQFFCEMVKAVREFI